MLRKKVATVVKKGGIEKPKSHKPPSTSSYDNQSIPTIKVRDRAIPLVFLESDRNLVWTDLDDSGETAITNDNIDTILFKDGENIICLIASKSSPKIRKNDVGGLSNEWLHNYSILYITTNPRAGMKVINYADKEIRNLNRLVTDGTNIKRYPNNGRTDFGPWFPMDLAYTIDGDQNIAPSLFLFEVLFGQRRCDT